MTARIRNRMSSDLLACLYGISPLFQPRSNSKLHICISPEYSSKIQDCCTCGMLSYWSDSDCDTTPGAAPTSPSLRLRLRRQLKPMPTRKPLNICRSSQLTETSEMNVSFLGIVNFPCTLSFWLKRNSARQNDSVVSPNLHETLPCLVTSKFHILRY